MSATGFAEYLLTAADLYVQRMSVCILRQREQDTEEGCSSLLWSEEEENEVEEFLLLLTGWPACN